MLCTCMLYIIVYLLLVIIIMTSPVVCSCCWCNRRFGFFGAQSYSSLNHIGSTILSRLARSCTSILPACPAYFTKHSYHYQPCLLTPPPPHHRCRRNASNYSLTHRPPNNISNINTYMFFSRNLTPHCIVFSQYKKNSSRSISSHLCLIPIFSPFPFSFKLKYNNAFTIFHVCVSISASKINTLTTPYTSFFLTFLGLESPAADTHAHLHTNTAPRWLPDKIQIFHEYNIL